MLPKIERFGIISLACCLELNMLGLPPWHVA